jgi:predicted HicB family RNase H-like nuclease
MSNSMSYRGYMARIEYDADDELFFGRLAGIRDGVSFHGDTVADLKAAFREAVDDYIAYCAKLGRDPQKPYSGNLMLRVDPQVHARAARAAELAGKTLNQWGEEALDAAAGAALGA